MVMRANEPPSPLRELKPAQILTFEGPAQRLQSEGAGLFSKWRPNFDEEIILAALAR